MRACCSLARKMVTSACGALTLISAHIILRVVYSLLPPRCVRTLKGHTGSVLSLLATCNRLLFSSSSDSTIRVRPVQSLRHTHKMHALSHSVAINLTRSSALGHRDWRVPCVHHRLHQQYLLASVRPRPHAVLRSPGLPSAPRRLDAAGHRATAATHAHWSRWLRVCARPVQERSLLCLWRRQHYRTYQKLVPIVAINVHRYRPGIRPS